VGGGQQALAAAAAAAGPEQQRRLATVVVGGGGATGVELAGELAEILPKVASAHGLAADRPAVQLVEAGPTILAGSSPQLIDKADTILSDLGVQGPHQRDDRRRDRGGLSGSRTASWSRAACSSGRAG
jgi:NADH dehydrogenase FAD-containing subunit